RTHYSQYDYIVINDGSSDATRKVCHEAGIRYMDLPVNVGLTGAVRAGMKYANYYDYDYAIQLDGDGQHDPRYIEAMLACMKEKEADIVIGSRFKEKKKPFSLRMLGSKIISGSVFVTTGGKYIGDVTSGMRLYNKKMIKKFGYKLNYRPEPDSIAYLINHGTKVEEVQVEMQERHNGKSYLGISSSIYYMTHVLFNIWIFQWIRKD
nr:glycosyltransferase family 2 protein [Lachnospiraceae bacterium]